MSEQSNNTAPAGWYPDPDVAGGQRWWDGAAWTGHVGQPYQPVAPLKAPEGTKTNTVWIWLIALMPLLALPGFFLMDVTGYIRDVVQNPASPTGMLSLYTSPGYLLAIVLGWGSTIASILFCYLDWRALKTRGVPAPFHWAFGFLVLASAGVVYPIGRSVVVKRRTGGGSAPMVVAIIVFALVVLASLVWVGIVTSQIFEIMQQYTPLYS